jgi:hypothetical protein
MLQHLTIHGQIRAALRRHMDDMYSRQQLAVSIKDLERDLLAEFAPTAYSFTPADGFHEMAEKMGYIPAADYEALKAKLAEVTDQLNDATSTLDQIEAESACFDGLARSAGYVKLEPGQVVVDAKPIIEHCEACNEEGLKVVCDGCVLRPIRDRIKEARDARV